MTISIQDGRAEALFASHIQPSDHPTDDELRDAIRNSVRTHNGVRGCACHVAAEYGDHPDTATTRMAWARQAVADLYPPRTRTAVPA